jgi:hypothetical protein
MAEWRAMTVIQVSERELSRLRVMVELADGRLIIAAAAELMGPGRRQVFRPRRAFVTAGPSGLISKKCGRPSNRRAVVRGTVLTLGREQYSDFRPTPAAEKLAYTARVASRHRDDAATDDLDRPAPTAAALWTS